jgi:hypothetical protein
MAETQQVNPAIVARLNQHFAELFGREPRYRYFQRDGGPMFCWTVERDEDGKYLSFVYRPVGAGARSGTATRWELVEAKSSKWKQVKHAKRKAAKARALRLSRADQEASRDDG